MAEKYNMKLQFTVPFAEYFQQKIYNSENRGLIGRMQGLEVHCQRSEKPGFLLKTQPTGFFGFYWVRGFIGFLDFLFE